MKTFNSEKFWNVLSILIYATLAGILGKLILNKGVDPLKIPIWEWTIMVFATYRMTRIMVYDRIFKTFRDLTKMSYTVGFLISMKNLITCPWCAGIWAAMVVLSLEFLVPYGVWLNYLLCIAGASTLVLVITNILGMAAEKKQMEVMKERRFDS